MTAAMNGRSLAPRGRPKTKMNLALFSTLERGAKLEALTDKALDLLHGVLSMEIDPKAEDAHFQQGRQDNAVRLVLTTQRAVDSEKLNARMTDKLGDLLAKLKGAEPKDVTPKKGDFDL